MPKNKKGHPSLEELLERPWCYYCERDFDDLKILIDHQRHKHFKCERCGRRLNTAGGLSVHLNHVHKEQLGPIENALPNRASAEVEIFGMEGIPEDIAAAHRQRVITQFSQAEADRRAATGNATPGSGGPAKKPKFESPAEMKKRLAEHRAKKAEENAAAEAVTLAAAAAPPVETFSYNGSPQPYAQSFQPNFPQAFSHPQTYPSPAFAAGASPAMHEQLPSHALVPSPDLPRRPSFQTGPPMPVQAVSDVHPPEATVTPPVPAESGREKKKKDKDKTDVRMVYADVEVSPEEKMAQMPRYAFDPAQRTSDTVLEDAEAKGNMVVAAPPAMYEDGPRTEG